MAFDDPVSEQAITHISHYIETKPRSTDLQRRSLIAFRWKEIKGFLVIFITVTCTLFIVSLLTPLVTETLSDGSSMKRIQRNAGDLYNGDICC